VDESEEEEEAKEGIATEKKVEDNRERHTTTVEAATVNQKIIQSNHNSIQQKGGKRYFCSMGIVKREDYY